MADFPNSTPVPDFDLESAICDLYGATKCLLLFTEVTFPNNNKRGGPFGAFREFHLNNEQFSAFFYLLYAVNGHVHHLRENLGLAETPKVQS